MTEAKQKKARPRPVSSRDYKKGDILEEETLEELSLSFQLLRPPSFKAPSSESQSPYLKLFSSTPQRSSEREGTLHRD
jgi:hypothetical protein